MTVLSVVAMRYDVAPSSAGTEPGVQGRPIQLQDACTGQLRGSYRGYNDKDEITAAYSVAFSPDGLRLYAGYNKAVRVFELQRPGRDYLQIDLASNGGPRGAAPGLPAPSSPPFGKVLHGFYNSSFVRFIKLVRFLYCRTFPVCRPLFPSPPIFFFSNHLVFFCR